MVTLRNPLAGIEAGESGQRPSVFDAPAVLDVLDQRLRADLRAALHQGRGRVLIVGGQWPGLALELATEGRFVTVVSSQSEVLTALRTAAQSAGLTRQLNLDARSYGDVSFEPGAFEAIVLYDPYAFLGLPRALFTKCRRELRTGGTLFARLPLASGAVFPEAPRAVGLTAQSLAVPPLAPRDKTLVRARDRVRRAVRGALRAARVSRPFAATADAPGLPWDQFEAAIGDQFVITRVGSYHVVGQDVAELACDLPRPLGRLVSHLVAPATRLDDWLLARPEWRPVASVALVHAAHQRELGRVFRVPR